MSNLISFLNQEELDPINRTKVIVSQDKPTSPNRSEEYKGLSTPLLILPSGAVRRTTIDPENPHHMFEWGPTNPNQYCNVGIVEGDTTSMVPQNRVHSICCNHDGNDTDRLPFIVRTSEANTRNFAKSIEPNRTQFPVDPGVNISERPMSPNQARLRQVEKQRHHGADLRKNEDDVYAQEAILNSIQNESSSRKLESEVSDDITAIVN